MVYLPQVIGDIHIRTPQLPDNHLSLPGTEIKTTMHSVSPTQTQPAAEMWLRSADQSYSKIDTSRIANFFLLLHLLREMSENVLAKFAAYLPLVNSPQCFSNRRKTKSSTKKPLHRLQTYYDAANCGVLMSFLQAANTQ